MTPTDIAALEIQLRRLLDKSGNRYSISSSAVFVDFLWDPGMSFDEVRALDSAVFVDSLDRPRRFVIQRLRGELRYWLATDRDPIAMSRTGEAELGVVASVEEAAALCGEFLDGEVRVRDLKTPRISGGQRRGRAS